MTEHVLQVLIDPGADAQEIAGRLADVAGVVEVRVPPEMAKADAVLDAARTLAYSPGAAPWYSGGEGSKKAPYSPLDVKQSPAHLERAYRLAVEEARKLEGTGDLIAAYAAARDTLLDAQR